MTFPTWLALVDTAAHVGTLTWLGVTLWRLKQERNERDLEVRVASDTHDALRARINFLREELKRARGEIASLTAARARTH